MYFVYVYVYFRTFTVFVKVCVLGCLSLISCFRVVLGSMCE